MSKLFLIRHAQSGNNASSESDRVCDPGITELGHLQAQALADFLSQGNFGSLICSAFRRALETAQCIRNTIGISPEVVIDLHEHGGCFAGWTSDNIRGMPGMTAAEIVTEFGKVKIPPDYPEKGWWSSRPREDELASALRACRIVEWFKKHLREIKSGDVVCVSHADFLAKILVEMFGQSIERHDDFFDLKNVGLTRVWYQDERWHLSELNSVDFLPKHLVSS